MSAALPLVRALMLVPNPIVRVPNPLSRVQAWSVGRDRKLFVSTPPLQTLSRHKILYRDRNSPALGKLCRDTRGPLSRPKHPIPNPNPMVTLNFYRNTMPTNICRNREGLCRNPNHPACLGLVSRHGDPCRDIEPKSSVVCAPRSCISAT